jgi:nicotinamide mononucleotide transporter
MNWIEFTGTVFGFLCVWLFIRQSIWSWPVGLIQVLLFILVFKEAKLYSDLALHVTYVGLQLYGWYYWLHGAEPGERLQVTRLGAQLLAAYAALSVAGAGILGLAMQTFTDAEAVYPDAFVASTSLVAQWLITRKKLESWIFWVVVDVVAICLYAYKGLYYATALYVLFLVLAVCGFIAWSRSFKRVHAL